ncbi:MAG: hypothetical protein ACLT8A_02400 [Subdoligranulum sp.]
MAAYLPTGISMLGGCCGSEPESIRLLKELTQDKTPAAKTYCAQPPVYPVRCGRGKRHYRGGRAHINHRQALRQACGRATAPMPAPEP